MWLLWVHVSAPKNWKGEGSKESLSVDGSKNKTREEHKMKVSHGLPCLPSLHITHPGANDESLNYLDIAKVLELQPWFCFRH